MEKVFCVVRYQLLMRTPSTPSVYKKNCFFFPTKDQAENHVNHLYEF